MRCCVARRREFIDLVPLSRELAGCRQPPPCGTAAAAVLPSLPPHSYTITHLAFDLSQGVELRYRTVVPWFRPGKPLEGRSTATDQYAGARVQLATFACPRCHFSNKECAPLGVPRPARGVTWELRVSPGARGLASLKRECLKGEHAMWEVPELGLEVPARTDKGTLNSVEGMLRVARRNLATMLGEGATAEALVKAAGGRPADGRVHRARRLAVAQAEARAAAEARASGGAAPDSAPQAAALARLQAETQAAEAEDAATQRELLAAASDQGRAVAALIAGLDDCLCGDHPGWRLVVRDPSGASALEPNGSVEADEDLTASEFDRSVEEEAIVAASDWGTGGLAAGPAPSPEAIAALARAADEVDEEIL